MVSNQTTETHKSIASYHMESWTLNCIGACLTAELGVGQTGEAVISSDIGEFSLQYQRICES
jgi:hypothetical protein